MIMKDSLKSYMIMNVVSKIYLLIWKYRVFSEDGSVRKQDGLHRATIEATSHGFSLREALTPSTETELHYWLLKRG
jgi:hypothetical protein